MINLSAISSNSGFRPARSLSRLIRRTRGEEGQALVEFAIIATVLLFIIIGILYFGRFLNYTLDETHLANIGARYAAVAQDPGATPLYQYLQSIAPGELQGSGDVTKATVCVKEPNNSGNPGDPVEVDVTTTYHFLPFLKVANTSVTESATMRLEQPLPSSFVGCAS